MPLRVLIADDEVLLRAGVARLLQDTGINAGIDRWIAEHGIRGGRGPVVPRAGLAAAHVLGLPWLHTWGSGRFAGVATRSMSRRR